MSWVTLPFSVGVAALAGNGTMAVAPSARGSASRLFIRDLLRSLTVCCEETRLVSYGSDPLALLSAGLMDVRERGGETQTVLQE